MGLCWGKPEPIEVIVPRFRTYHRRLISCWIVLAVITEIITDRFTNIGILHSIGGYFPLFDEYKVNGTTVQVPSYDSIHKWQTCLFQPDYVFSTVPNVDYVISTFDNDIKHLSKNLEKYEIPLDGGTYQKFGGPMLESLLFVGEVVTGMTFLGQMALYLAWKHPGWLLSAGCFGLYCSLMSFTYYNADPPIPVPVKTNGTLFLFIVWLKKEYFDDVNGGNNQCDPAYYYVALYLALCVIMTLIMGCGTSMAFHAEYCRYKFAKPLPAPELKKEPSTPPEVHSEKQELLDKKYYYLNLLRDIAIVNVICMACMYFSCFLGRVLTSFNALGCINDYNGVIPGGPAPTPTPTAAPHFRRSLIGDDHPTAMPTATPTLAPHAPDMDIIYYPDRYFPFGYFTINITSPLWATVFVSGVRGWMHGRVSPYRLSFIAATGYVLMDLPGMLSSVQIFTLLEFYKVTTCVDTFKNAVFIYPSEYQAEIYCTAMNFTNFAALVLLLLMGIQAIVCGCIWYFFYDEIEHLVFNGTDCETSPDTEDVSSEAYKRKGEAGSLSMTVSPIQRSPSQLTHTNGINDSRTVSRTSIASNNNNNRGSISNNNLTTNLLGATNTMHESKLNDEFL